MINTQKKSLLSLLSVSQPQVIKMTSHCHTRLKLNQIGGNTVIYSILRKSDYKTFFFPHVVCLPFFLFEFEGSHLGDKPTASLWLCTASCNVCPCECVGTLQAACLFAILVVWWVVMVCAYMCMCGRNDLCFRLGFLTGLEGINQPFFKVRSIWSDNFLRV